MRVIPRRRDPTSEDLARQAERMLRRDKPDNTVADKFREAHDKAIIEALASPVPQDRRTILSKAMDYALKSADHFEQAARTTAVGRTGGKTRTPDTELEAMVRLGEKARYFESAAEMVKKALPLAGSISSMGMQSRINALMGNARVAQREISYISANLKAEAPSGTGSFREARRRQA